MSWVKLDDQFGDHPKVTQVGPLAAWLYICGLCYASRYLTDGFIPTTQIRRLADLDDPAGLAQRLIAARLWEVVEGGVQIHDYLDYNPSAERVKAEREADRQRKATGQNVAANRNRNGFRLESERNRNGHSKESGRNPTVPYPYPSRSTTQHTASTDRQSPAPLEPEVCVVLGKAALRPWERKRLTELTAAYAPDVVLAAVAWAKEHCGSPNGVLGYAAKCIGSAPWEREVETPSGSPVQQLEDAKRYFARLDREYGGE